MIRVTQYHCSISFQSQDQRKRHMSLKKEKKNRKDISVSQHFKLCRNDVDKPWPKVGVVNLFGNRNWCVAIAASNKNPMVYAATAGVFSFSHSAYRPLAFATRLDSH